MSTSQQLLLQALGCSTTNDLMSKYGIKWKDGIYTYNSVDYEDFSEAVEAVYQANKPVVDEYEKSHAEEYALAKKHAEASEAIKSMLTVTSPKISGREIEKTLGMVSADCAYGMNIFRDLFAQIRDVVGGRSVAVEKVLKDAKQTVTQEMCIQAHMMGANAIISIDYDFNELDGGNKNGMLLVSGTGTAVKLREID